MSCYYQNILFVQKDARILFLEAINKLVEKNPTMESYYRNYKEYDTIDDEKVIVWDWTNHLRMAKELGEFAKVFEKITEIEDMTGYAYKLFEIDESNCVEIYTDDPYDVFVDVAVCLVYKIHYCKFLSYLSYNENRLKENIMTLKKEIIIVNGDECLVTEESEVIVFDTVEEAEECRRYLGEGNVVRRIVFNDKKINWKAVKSDATINGENLIPVVEEKKELTPIEIFSNIVDELTRAKEMCQKLINNNKNEIETLVGEYGKADILMIDINADLERLDVLANALNTTENDEV